jgi:hypothetical protein
MISVILYGRNDSHGYNLHKRAAISLNCIAEVLRDPCDEILFVDYNTPNDLPTFIEAIYDTLTPRVKSLLRVFRVRPELHARMVERTHLSALEPHSRNIGIRRSNPQNRWVLFTNTDMVFVPRGDSTSLGDVVRDLADGQYILPRFELPEPLWEAFARSDPHAVMRACEDLGRKLHLNEITVSHPYMRFDSPGDFQLAPRHALFEIHGFEERMIHGWHSDSNLCKRLYLFYGRRTESLAQRLKGYHCDHTRVTTAAHRIDVKLENDSQEFVYGVEDPVAHHQAAVWGVPEEPIEEVDFAHGPQARFTQAVERALGAPQEIEYYSDANDLRNFVSYQPEHALPYLAGNLTVYPPGARFVYVGNNPRMLQLTTRCVQELGFKQPLHYVSELLSSGMAPQPAKAISAADVPADTSLSDYLMANYDLLIFDFGLDLTGLNLGRINRVTDWPKHLRFSLGAVARCLESCAEAAPPERKHTAEFLVLNANHYVFRQFVGQFLLAADTPYNTHVRKGRPRIGEERLYRSHVWKYTEECLISFFGYDNADCSLVAIAPGHSIDMTSSSSQSSRYKDGHWGWTDFAGTWTDGTCASIVFAPPTAVEDDLLAYVSVVEAFLGLNGDPIRVQVVVEGKVLGRWAVRTRYGMSTFRILIPRALMSGKSACRLEFHIENPQSTQLQATLKGEQVIGEDPRELGIKVQRITFAGTDQLKYTLRQTVDFREKGRGVYHIDECWTQPDNLGTWTLGADANLVFFLQEPVDASVVAAFTITDVAVNDEFPYLDVSVAFNRRDVATWRLGPNRSPDERKVVVPLEILRVENPLTISFHVDSPRSPIQLKWSDSDTRQLGFRLTTLCMEPVRAPKYKLGDVLDFTSAGNAARYLGGAWTAPDNYGCWTLGPKATMTVGLDNPPATAMPAAFIISDCMVSETVPELPVRVTANGQLVGEWLLGPGRTPHLRSIELPADVVASSQELTLAFEVATPRSPASLGWSATDSRPLGLRITRALLGRGELSIPDFAGTGGNGSEGVARLRNFVASALRGFRAAVRGAT